MIEAPTVATGVIDFIHEVSPRWRCFFDERNEVRCRD